LSLRSSSHRSRHLQIGDGWHVPLTALKPPRTALRKSGSMASLRRSPGGIRSCFFGAFPVSFFTLVSPFSSPHRRWPGSSRGCRRAFYYEHADPFAIGHPGDFQHEPRRHLDAPRHSSRSYSAVAAAEPGALRLHGLRAQPTGRGDSRRGSPPRPPGTACRPHLEASSKGAASGTVPPVIWESTATNVGMQRRRWAIPCLTPGAKHGPPERAGGAGHRLLGLHFSDRMQSLKLQLLEKESIDGSSFAMSRISCHERQREHDPVGFRSSSG